MSGGTDPGAGLARLYRDAIRRHSTEPVGYRQDIGPTHRHEHYNPQCGDRIEVLLRVRDATIDAAAFEGEACAICMASASLLCSLAPGSTAAELQALGDGLQAALTAPAEGTVDATVHPDLRPLLGVRPYPSRVRCATLPWTAAKRALSG